jgi:glucan-binding YG repeat protein
MKKLLFSALFVFFLSISWQTQVSAAIPGYKHCLDFKDGQALVDFWLANGYSTTNDPLDLDYNNDGYPCNLSKFWYEHYAKILNGWKQINGNWYYYYPMKQTPETGWLFNRQRWYFFDGKGVMQTGWLKNGGTWYYLASSGAMSTGWVKSGNAWYYLDTSGAMKTGWLKWGKKWYYLDASGAMKTGLIQSGGQKYWLDSDGSLRIGWVAVNGKWYYQGENGFLTGWVNDGGTWYLLAPDGVMKTGWAMVGNQWYFLEKSGAMRIGWLQQGSVTYYLDDNGMMVTGWYMLENSGLYYFYSNGVMAKNTVIEGRTLGSDGAWIPDNFEIIADIAKQYNVGAYVESEESIALIHPYDGMIGIIEDGYLIVDGVYYMELGIQLALALGLPSTYEELADYTKKSYIYKTSYEFPEWAVEFIEGYNRIMFYW